VFGEAKIGFPVGLSK